MSNPAALAAVPGLIRATRFSVEANPPSGALARGAWAAVLFGLLYCEGMAERLVQLVPEAVEAAKRPPQQIHAPIADQVEPLVPRWAGHDPRLPPGRPHP